MSGRSKPKPLIVRNDRVTTGTLNIGDRVKFFLHSDFWESEGWFEGTVLRIDPYSEHRSFFWVELDAPVRSRQGGLTNQVSVLNVKKIRKING